MSRPITSLFALYILTPGRRIYALGRVLERAKAKDLAELVAAIEAAIAHDRHVLELDAARFERAKIPVRERDAEVDRTLGTIEHLLSHYAQTTNLTASTLLVTLFPNGLAHHIRLPHIEQAAANERVLSILEGNTHKQWLDVHGLRPLIEQLRAEHDAFAAALHARDAESVPTWDEVKQARERGQELYLHIVATIVAQFGGKPDVLDDLLEPVWAQDQLIQDYRRQRRNVADVDPDSGEVLEEHGDEPADEIAEQGDDEPNNA
jgi:hypothetical protein